MSAKIPKRDKEDAFTLCPDAMKRAKERSDDIRKVMGVKFEDILEKKSKGETDKETSTAAENKTLPPKKLNVGSKQDLPIPSLNPPVSGGTVKPSGLEPAAEEE
ncbi:hypothetical protein B0T21DRAFT_351156 [Apiosordaria backusii]|uniref:Uncharacterized protein n=1 Tax=Apiosordaria backusii TaxID=314023 RepID=A0AA40ASM4_9PEZI|nr:hypothetical protein B0T21DRAFT_351156 [Apiosordaria backusii]